MNQEFSLLTYRASARAATERHAADSRAARHPQSGTSLTSGRSVGAADWLCSSSLVVHSRAGSGSALDEARRGMGRRPPARRCGARRARAPDRDGSGELDPPIEPAARGCSSLGSTRALGGSSPRLRSSLRRGHRIHPARASRRAPYLLVPRDAPASAGWELWVRYDLAPRRPVLMRSRADGRLSGPRGTAVPQRVDWAVVRGDGDIPLLLSRAELLARRRAPDDDR